MSLFTVLGLVGVGLIILAYLFLQTGKDTADSLRYLWLNLIGSALIALSLIAEWNLPTLVIEVFWISITLYGFVRVRKKRLHSNAKGEGAKKSAGDINFSLAPKPEQD